MFIWAFIISFLYFGYQAVFLQLPRQIKDESMKSPGVILSLLFHFILILSLSWLAYNKVNKIVGLLILLPDAFVWLIDKVRGRKTSYISILIDNEGWRTECIVLCFLIATVLGIYFY